MNKTSIDIVENDDKIDARVGYENAINLWVYQGEQIWARFNVMLVANSIMIFAITNTNNPSLPLPHLTKVLAGVGLAICIAWYFLMRRANKYQTYYIYSAIELERRLSKVSTVSRGKDFAKGKEVNFEIDEKKNISSDMRCLACLTSEIISYFQYLRHIAISIR